jgi:hypothetical protein
MWLAKGLLGDTLIRCEKYKSINKMKVCIFSDEFPKRVRSLTVIRVYSYSFSIHPLTDMSS